MSEFGRQGRKRKNSGLSYPSPLQQRLTYHLCWQWRYNLGSNRSLFISIVKEEPFTFEWRMWCQYHFWSTPLQCFCLLFLTDWSPTFFRPKGQQYINKQSWFDRCNGYLCIAAVALWLKPHLRTSAFALFNVSKKKEERNMLLSSQLASDCDPTWQDGPGRGYSFSLLLTICLSHVFL